MLKEDPALQRDSSTRPSGVDAVVGAARDSGQLETNQLQALIDAALSDDTPPPVVKEERADPYAGLVVDQRYAVESLLAEGGMGRVYRCRHCILDKKLAIKIIRADVAQQPDSAQRFLIEAKAASAVGNEHIIDIIDFGALPDGAAYLVMELLEGVPLSSLVDDHQPFPAARIARLALQIAEGLAAAHAAGIVHRDLKPDNIILLQRKGEDFIKILDFGVAQMAFAPGSKLTQAGSVVGTPHYMSPEQCSGGAVDHTSDVYALGIMLYELASGRVPFDASHYLAVLQQHVLERPTPFAALTPSIDVPPELERIIFKCLAKLPHQRYGSMAELMAELAPLAQKENAPLALVKAAAQEPPERQATLLLGVPGGKASSEAGSAASRAAEPLQVGHVSQAEGVTSRVPTTPLAHVTFPNRQHRLYLALLALGALIAAWGLRGLFDAEPALRQSATPAPTMAERTVAAAPHAPAAIEPELPDPPAMAPTVRPLEPPEPSPEPAAPAKALRATSAAPPVEVSSEPRLKASPSAKEPPALPASKSASAAQRPAPAKRRHRSEFINPWPER